MKNAAAWKPTKYYLLGDRLMPSQDQAMLGVRSRFVGALQAMTYQQVIQRHARGVLIDLGCGDVPLYLVYRTHVSEIICVDWADSIHANPHVDIEADLNQGLPLPDATADTILSTDVLEHIRDPFMFWKEVGRVLKPGGKVILTAPFLYWLHEEPHDYFRYTRHRLKAFCDENGLIVLELFPYGGPLAVILDIIGKNLPWFVAAYQSVAKAFYRSRLGQRIDERNRHSFPIGYVVVAVKALSPHSEIAPTVSSRV